ncbi:MAG: DUF4214 domain-containing protein [Pseudomonadota bacterium]
MSIEFDDDSYPGSAVVYIEATWGRQTFSGSGVIVGQNDVLTASHVVFDQNRGGFADEVLIYPSYDPDATDNVAYSYRYGQYFPGFDPDGDGLLYPGDFNSTTLGESELDIALLATSEPIGDIYGTFGIDYDFAAGQASVAGYPGAFGLQPTLDTGFVGSAGVDSAIRIDRLEVNPGNSGGPIFTDTPDRPEVVGVVSTGIAAANVGAHEFWLPNAIEENDSFLDTAGGADDQLPSWFTTGSADILGGETNDALTGSAADNILYGFDGADVINGAGGDDVAVGGPGDDRLIGGGGDDVLVGGAGFDTLEGGAGLDSAVYWFNRADYGVSGAGAAWEIAFSGGGSEGLSDVERVMFADGTLALDLDGAAGQAYRLYSAVLGRSPDTEGLGFWTGQLDDGLTLTEAAGLFLESAEFMETFGSDLDDAAYLDTLYRNVLGRPGDAAGTAYWEDRLDAGLGRDAALALFSESAENQLAVADEIADGIWLG